MTIGELIANAEQRLINAGVQFGQGTLNAWDESRWLVLAALQLPVDSPLQIEDQSLTDLQVLTVQKAIDRRATHKEPVAYITGTAWLKGYSFRVDPRVLIPRSFIAEMLINQCAPWVKDPLAVKSVLDLCTGSGCLAIMAADAFPNAQVLASDISPDALQVAAMNVNDYAFHSRITLIESNVFDQIQSPAPSRFDLIISNPPYVPEDRMAHLPAEFIHEPRLALAASDHGMAIVRKILAHAANHLSASGLVIVEVGHEKKACQDLCEKEFSGLPLIWLETPEQSDTMFLVDAATLQSHPWSPTP
jgi:ribosomal protein L3 glutamine methyltransferase